MWCIYARRRCCVQISASFHQFWEAKKGLVTLHLYVLPSLAVDLSHLEVFKKCQTCWLFHSEPKCCISIHCGLKFCIGIVIVYLGGASSRISWNEAPLHCCNWIDYLSLQGLHPRSLYHLLSPISARYETGCCDRKKGHIGGSESKNMNSITYNP